MGARARVFRASGGHKRGSRTCKTLNENRDWNFMCPRKDERGENRHLQAPREAASTSLFRTRAWPVERAEAESELAHLPGCQ